MRRQQEDIALVQVHPLVAATVPQQQVGAALDLVEILLVRVVVEVGALLGRLHRTQYGEANDQVVGKVASSRRVDVARAKPEMFKAVRTLPRATAISGGRTNRIGVNPDGEPRFAL